MELSVFDVTGKLIETLVEEPLSAGTYAIVWDASRYASGVYFYTLRVADFVDTKRVIVLK